MSIAVSVLWLMAHRVWVPVDMSCHVPHAAPIVATGERVPVACPPTRALGQPRIVPGGPRVWRPWTPPRSAVPAR